MSSLLVDHSYILNVLGLHLLASSHACSFVNRSLAAVALLLTINV
jgi:hypothetical protein